jgi:hypothetical protein
LTDAERIEQLKQLITTRMAAQGLTGFDVECGGGNTILISRAGHVHATWNAAAGRLSFTQAGYGAPSFTTLDVEAAAAHTLRLLAQTKST